MTLCYETTQKKSNDWSSPPSRGFLSEKSIFMDGLGERVFTLLSSVNHFYWTFFQASSGQGAYTRTLSRIRAPVDSETAIVVNGGKAREREVSDAKGNSSTKASVVITRPSCLIDSPSIIQSRKQSQRPLKKDDFYFKMMTSILRYWVGQSKSPKAKKKSKNRGDAFLIGHWLSIPGVFLSVKGTLSFLNKHGAIRTKS